MTEREVGSWNKSGTSDKPGVVLSVADRFSMAGQRELSNAGGPQDEPGVFQVQTMGRIRREYPL
ncbi:MAG TPA: hypothetical protein PLP57_04810 [Candidatus Saccharicenans sp.]|nr:hypothetical protein [Candidatus Saccharicenans sp.]HRD01948.1 hypothetical protein [Candidatus Saccharicenans sp.]